MSNRQLVYVDTSLILPIAAKLVGSSIKKSTKKANNLGFDYFLSLKRNMETGSEIQSDISDLFSEDIFDLVYERIEHKQMSVTEFCEQASDKRLQISSAVSVKGTLNFPNITIPKEYNPFDPPEIHVPKTFKLGNTNCIVSELKMGGYKLPVYLPESSKEIVCFCAEKEVEIVGILKWSPVYSVNNIGLSTLLLGACLLLV